jgi:putative hydrolase of the HAD superfamily
MNMKIRGVGFDLGETLIFYRDTPLNWASLYSEALRCVANSCNLAPTPKQFADAERVLTRHNTRLVPRTHEVPAQKILSLVLSSWDHDAVPDLAGAVDAFFSFFQQHMCAYPETVEVLAALRKQGIHMGILTDVPYGMPRAFVQRDLERAGISGLFDALLTSVEVGVRKPEPAGFLALASSLGIAPHEMLYVGNEPKDVIGANRAGVIAAFLDRASSGSSHGQAFTIPTLSSVPEIVRQMQ